MKFRKETKWAVAASAAVLLALVAGAVWIGSYMGPLGEKQAERTGQEEMVAENGILSPEEGLRTDAGPGNGMGAASLEGAETVPAEGVRLELTERKDACPYVELSFRVIEETGEPRTFSSDPEDIPLRAEFDTEELVNWGCFAKTADKENDTVTLWFWSAESGSVTVTLDGLSYTAEFQREEPEKITRNQEIAVYGGTAMMDSVLVYPDAVTVNLSGLSSEAYQNTVFILAEEGTVYGDGNDLDGYTGMHSYGAEDEMWTQTYAFPDGLPKDRDLVFRVINMQDRDEQSFRLCEDYPLGSA